MLCICCYVFVFFFFFKQKTAYELRISDWSSDVCSSDLLFNAHTDPAFRGRNVLPFLRHQLYLELTRRGRTNLISSTDIFNGPAHRFKRKLGAVPVEARLYVKFGNRIEKVFILRRFPTARGPTVAPELALGSALCRAR